MVQTAGIPMQTHDWYNLDSGEALTLTTSVSSSSSPTGSAEAIGFDTIKVTYAASASADALKITAPFSFTILDWVVQGKAAVANGTVTLINDGNTVEALACAAVDTITRSSSLDLTYKSVTKGKTVKVQANSPGIEGILVIKIRPE